MLHVLDILLQLFFPSNYIGEKDQMALDLLKRSNTYHWTFRRVSKGDNEKEFKRYILGGILDLQKKPCKIRESFI